MNHLRHQTEGDGVCRPDGLEKANSFQSEVRYALCVPDWRVPIARTLTNADPLPRPQGSSSVWQTTMPELQHKRPAFPHCIMFWIGP